MKTATCALVLDVSKFDGPMDSAKSKLSSFGQLVQKSASVAQTAINVWNTAQNIASGINTISEAVSNVNKGFNALKSFGVNASSVLSRVGSIARTAGSALMAIPTPLKIVAGVAVGAGAGLYGVYKAGQAVAGITKSIVGGIGTIIGKLQSMASSAISGAASLAKVAGSAVSKGFSAISGVVGLAGKALAGLGISLGGLDVFFKTGIVSAFQMGDELKTLRDRTGASIPFIYDLQKAFKNAGMSGDAVAPVLQSMGRALTGVNADGEPTNKMLGMLKLNTDQLKGMTTEEQFKAITAAISKLASPAERSAAAIAIFGRNAGALTAVIAGEEINNLGKNVSGPAKVLEENAETFSQISIELRKSGEMFKGFFIMIAGKIGAPLLEIMKAFSGGSFLEGIGEKIGNVLGGGLTIFANAIKQGKVFELLKEGFITAIMVAGDTLIRYMAAAVDAIVGMWNAGLIQKGVVALINRFIAGTQVMGGYLLKIFQTPIVYLQAGIQLVVEKLLEGIAKIPGGAKLLGIDKNFKAGSFSEIKKGIEEGGGAKLFGASADEMISSGMQGLAKSQGEIFSVAKDGMKIFSDSLAKQGEMISGTGEQLKKFGDLTASLSTPIETTKSKIEQSGASIEEGTSLAPPESKIAEKSRQAENAISSLQKIGGGGGAFGGDPMLRNSDKQVVLQERMVALMEDQKKRSETQGGAMAGGFGYAVLA
ncbi:MAG: hypothetical protein EBZ87_00315 [Microbacteriaceae bacterium]|nr:hypothetical protein [Microbacteriaceae bacterium]